MQLIILLSIFGASCMCHKIRCNGECEKFCNFFGTKQVPNFFFVLSLYPIFLFLGMSVFCQPISEFICMSRCFWETMVAFKDTRNYSGSDRSPMFTLKERSSVCFSAECSQVLTMGYARRMIEVGQWRWTSQMNSWLLRVCRMPSLLLYKFGARPHTKR